MLRCMALAAVLSVATACSSDSSAGPSSGLAYVRVINATFLDSSATTPPAPYRGVPIDVLIDSAAGSPSFLNVAANSVSDLSDGTGPAPGRLNAGYHAVPAGVHSFVARVSGLTPEGPSFFTTDAGTQYLPKQYLTGNTYYTFLIAGKAKPQATGVLPTPVLNAPTDFGYDFPLLIDDPFTPPAVGDVLQARFHVINAVPFSATDGTGTGVFIFVTRTPSLVGIQYLGYADYRYASQYINLTGGTVYVSIANSDGSVIYTQQQITFGAGEVRTLVFQSNRQSVPLTGYDPGASSADFTLSNIKDNQY